MGISSKKHKKVFDEINITPLTDIFLVLLIIMMVIAPLLDQQVLNLSMPSNDNTKTKTESKIITVDVADKDQYSIDGQPASKDSLLSMIKEAAKQKKDGVLIQAAGDSTHGSVVNVMDAARNAGIANISVIEK